MDDVFGCGHARTPQNTTQERRCRQCRTAYHRGYARVRYELLKALTATVTPVAQ